MADKKDERKLVRVRVTSQRDEPSRMATAPASDQEPRKQKILSAADLRNATIESTIKQLERLEIGFPEGDPIRRALTDCRREVAKHFVTKGPGGGGGLRAVK